jgi:hypothetical protein
MTTKTPDDERTIRGRRLATAPRTLAVVLIALLLGALLDARGLRKTAAMQPPGLGRDVAVAVTEPLAALASATRLDQMRLGVQRALGRDDADEIATSIDLPAPSSAAPRTRPPTDRQQMPDAPTRGRPAPTRPTSSSTRP